MRAGDLLVGDARERRPRSMARREQAVSALLATGFIAGAATITLVFPPVRTADPLLLLGLILMYAVFSRVEFEVGSGYAVPEQLVFVPMLFLAPLPLVPPLVAAGFLVAGIPDVVEGRTHTARWLNSLSDSWFTLGPVVVLALLAPGEPRLDLAEVYALAFCAQVASGLVPALVGERFGAGIPIRHTLHSVWWSYRIDAMLSPVALMVAVVAADTPIALGALAPLVWLMHVFSVERRERYAAALELNRAYQGTVMLLSEVVEAEDEYTADHCRSVVELAHAVGDELGVEFDDRQELEFAALLHDVGKISIDDQILNKQAPLSDAEFEEMKRHTIEGQALLDRVGGLLGRVGEIVRSCHERWDGTGYPDGLAGDEIPLAARIVFCCDAYNAMTTNRPYRRAMSPEAAMAELHAHSGTQFDPEVVAALSEVISRGVPASEPMSAEAVRSLLARRPVPPELGPAR